MIAKRQALAKKRLATLNRTTALVPHIGDADGLRERWSEINLSRQQQIVGALLDHVVVGPARRGYNRFDPSRLQPTLGALKGPRPQAGGCPTSPTGR